jgi:glyoxylate/hydroxypyruvate reductase A
MGRGDHLLETDLLDALDKGLVQAATLDVMSVEPLPVDHAFWNHPDILITPHVAGLPSPQSAVRQVAENVRRAMRAAPLLNPVYSSRGY